MYAETCRRLPGEIYEIPLNKSLSAMCEPFVCIREILTQSECMFSVYELVRYDKTLALWYGISMVAATAAAAIPATGIEAWHHVTHFVNICVRFKLPNIFSCTRQHTHTASNISLQNRTSGSFCSQCVTQTFAS